MKKNILSIFAILVILILLFVCGCQENAPQKEKETTDSISTDTDIFFGAETDPLIIDDIVLPPTRFSKIGVTWHYSYYQNSFSYACKNSEGIARVKIGNFVREERYSDNTGATIFEATILEAYKGELSGDILLRIEAYSLGSLVDISLPIYGEEVIVFLERYSDDPEGLYNVYCNTYEYLIIDLNGREYVVIDNKCIPYEAEEHSIIDYSSSLREDIVKKINEYEEYLEEKIDHAYPIKSTPEILNIFELDEYLRLISIYIE